MMPISRRYAGTSVIRWPSMAISPLSGIKKPPTRLSSVVLPQPDGPSSVISSPRRTSSDTSSSAVVLPKRLVTASSSTAISASPFARVAAAAESLPSAGMLNVQHLCQAKEDVGQRQQRCGDHNVHDRDRGHRGVGVFAHVVVKRNRHVCVRWTVTNSEAVNSLNDRIAANNHPPTRPGSSNGNV